MEIKKSDIWRNEYRKRRYLEHLRSADLNERLFDLTNNLLTIGNDGKLKMRSITIQGKDWLEKLTHVYEEFALRNEDLPKGDKSLCDKLPMPTYPNAPSSYLAVKDYKFNDGKYLVKYGKLKYLKKAFEEGILRIQPASAYNDTALNYAIKDDELGLNSFALPSEVKLEVIDPRTNQSKGPLIPKGNLKYDFRFKTNYYVYCVARTFDHRYFKDFDNADCCIIVKDVEAFSRILENSVNKILPCWKFLRSSINYLDPFDKDAYDPRIPISKHFSFAYQFEYRFLWLPYPSNIVQELKPLDIRMGSLKGVVDYIEL